MIYIAELKEKIPQKEQSEIGHNLLLRGLQTEYGFTDLPEISKGVFGKPFFKEYPEIHFNISHCDNAVACLIADRPVGLDVECIKSFDPDLAEYVSTREEFQQIITNPDPALAFIILWTKKESYVKLTGKGLDTQNEIRNILTNNPINFNTIINKAGGYVLTSCS